MKRLAASCALATVLLCACASLSRKSAIATPSDSELGALSDQLGKLIETGRFDEALQQANDAWTRGWHRDLVAYGAAGAASRGGRINDAFMWLQRAVDAGLTDSSWMNHDPDLAAVRGDARYGPLVARMRRLQERRVDEMNVGGGLPKSTPEAEGIGGPALEKLVDRAQATHSSALVLLRHGKLVGQWYFEGPSGATETMSATKAVVSLAVGFLVDEGKIRSVDEPVSTWFPEWKDGAHDGITLRHLLSHTSGLHADRTTERIYASNDFVRFALQSGIDARPGSEFFYNNSAVNLIAGVVQRASGRPMDDYLRARLFGPLGIRDVSWSHDRAGNPHGMAGLQIHAADFAKIGQMMLRGGTWNGKRVVSETWIGQSTERPAQVFDPLSGLLWWLETPNANVVIDQPFLEALRTRGADPVFIAKLEPLRDRPVPTAEFTNELLRALGADGIAQWTKEAGQRRLQAPTVVTGEYDGFSARGSYGQILLVYPSRGLVAVRLTTSFDLSDSTVGFPDFATLVRGLAAPTIH